MSPAFFSSFLYVVHGSWNLLTVSSVDQLPFCMSSEHDHITNLFQLKCIPDAYLNVLFLFNMSGITMIESIAVIYVTIQRNEYEQLKLTQIKEVHHV